MRTYVIKDRRPIPLGRVGENEATTIKFNIASFFPGMSGATYGLIHKLPEAAAPYVVDTTHTVISPEDGRVRDGFINWVVKDTDLVAAGNGVAQLTAYRQDGSVYKTAVFTTVIENSLGVVEPPKGTVPWADKVIKAGDSVLGSAQAAATSASQAEAAAAEAKTISDNIPTAVANAAEIVLGEAKASGEFDGADGYSPTVTVQPITGGHQVTITDVDGDHTFIVADGEDGSGGGGVPEIFWVTPWVTTLAELETAYQNGKVLMIRMDMYVFLLQYRQEDGSVYSFTSAFQLRTGRTTLQMYVCTLECAFDEEEGEEDWDMFLNISNTNDIYWAEYGETTAATMIRMLNFGNTVMCKATESGVDRIYVVSACNDDENYPTVTLVSTDGPALGVINVMDSNGEPTWLLESYTFPNPAASGTPAMDGTAFRGSSEYYARADHVHPTDTSRAPAAAGLPAGGNKGYTIKKKSSNDFDVEWQPAVFDFTAVTNSSHVATANVPAATLMEKLNNDSVDCYAYIDGYEGILRKQGIEYLVSDGVTYWTFRFAGIVVNDTQTAAAVGLIEFRDQATTAQSLVGTGKIIPIT